MLYNTGATVEEAGEILNAENIPFFVDAAQSVGCLDQKRTICHIRDGIRNMSFWVKWSDIKMGDIKRALESVEFDAFEVRCKGLGMFASKGSKIIWVDADGHGGRMLGELAAKVAKALIPLGFVQKAKFQPHLTVFRVKNKVNDTANVLKRFENTEFGMQKVDAIKLKSSVLSSSGPTYGDLMVVGAKK